MTHEFLIINYITEYREVNIMKKSSVSRLLVTVFSAALIAASLTACGPKKEASSEELFPESPAPAAAQTAPAAPAAVQPSENETVSEPVIIEEDDAEEKSVVDLSILEEEENTDVTAGVIEEGYYSATATIGISESDASANDIADDDEDEWEGVVVTIDSSEKALKNQDASKAPAAELKGGDLNAARKAYYLDFNDGDEEMAETDLEDFKEVQAPSDSQIKELSNYYEDLGKMFYQFDITNYDFTTAYDCDSEYIEYDIYTSDNKLFYLDCYFDSETGLLTDLDLTEDDM